MGKPLDLKLIEKYANAFKKVEVLQHRGFSFLVDVSGSIHKRKKLSLRDVEGNTEAIYSVQKQHSYSYVGSDLGA